MTHATPILTIVAALTCEVRPWVDYHQLKKSTASPFDLFRSDHSLGNVEVVVSGIGANAMATAVGWVAAQDQRARVWLNLGTAGHATRSVGDIIRVHGVASSETARAHYPPMTAAWTGATSAVLSVDTPSDVYPGGAAVDMEAASFFASATRFASAEFVQSLKVISDNEVTGIENLNATKITALMQPHVEQVNKFAEALLQLVPQPSQPFNVPALHKLRTTVSQKRQLKRLLHQVQVLGLEQVVNDLRLDDSMPAKTVLSRLRAEVDSAVPVINDLSDVR